MGRNRTEDRESKMRILNLANCVLVVSAGSFQHWSVYCDLGAGGIPDQTFALRKRNAFPITDTELNAIAAAANTGVSSNPQKGYSTPAAIGMPRLL